MIPRILSDLLNWANWQRTDGRYIWCLKDRTEEWYPTLQLCGITITDNIESQEINRINARLCREGKPAVAFTTKFLFVPAPDITSPTDPAYSIPIYNEKGGTDKLWCIGAGMRLDYKATTEHFIRTMGDHHVHGEPDWTQHPRF